MTSTKAALRTVRTLVARRFRLLTQDSERGSVAAELAIATPALALLLLIIVQFGLIWSAQQAAQTAAAQAVNAARAHGANPGLGQSEGEQALHQLASAELPDGTVTVSYTGTVATVVVTGDPESLIPGWHPHITAQASSPIETLTP